MEKYDPIADMLCFVEGRPARIRSETASHHKAMMQMFKHEDRVKRNEMESVGFSRAAIKCANTIFSLAKPGDIEAAKGIADA